MVLLLNAERKKLQKLRHL